MRKLGAEKQRELASLLRRSELILDFLETRGLSHSIAQEMKAALRATSDRNDLTGLRIATRDLDGWRRELDPVDRRELDELLRVEAPDDPQTEAMRITAIALRRGRLIDDRECEAAVAVIEMLEEDPVRLERRDQLETLVAAYNARQRGGEAP